MLSYHTFETIYVCASQNPTKQITKNSGNIVCMLCWPGLVIAYIYFAKFCSNEKRSAEAASEWGGLTLPYLVYHMRIVSMFCIHATQHTTPAVGNSANYMPIRTSTARLPAHRIVCCLSTFARAITFAYSHNFLPFELVLRCEFMDEQTRVWSVQVACLIFMQPSCCCVCALCNRSEQMHTCTQSGVTSCSLTPSN